ncbi:hypothetical protein WDJ51_08240 [Rathayibacter sp. YIM 133350]|uniref:DUF7882 family protein n=1 Tax=Rathayibacter sp. YIM 133350 TaxID=3131992 RepID=UPI00307D3A6B
MGTLFYGSAGFSVEIDDLLLAHLKVVIVDKLRRNESFAVNYTEGDDTGPRTLWIHATIPLRFTFSEPVAPALSREVLNDLARQANTTNGLSIRLQPELEAQPERQSELAVSA